VKKGKFHVGVTRDLRSEDGSFLFEPAADLALLDAQPAVEWEFLREAEPMVTLDIVAGYDALLHFGPPLDAEAVGNASRLALVARSGVGLDAIDMDACTAAGVAVTITPEGVAGPMASAAVALVLALAHRLTERNDAFHRGAWNDGRSGVIGVGLRGRTLGLIGYGRIGRSVKRLRTRHGSPRTTRARTASSAPSWTRSYSCPISSSSRARSQPRLVISSTRVGSR
jgi:phosphoglycerate dehydrogenase-like enzyme